MSAETITNDQARSPFSYSKFVQTDRDVVTPWLTLDEISNQLNLYSDDSQDTYLSSLELAARLAIEDYLGLSIFATSYRAYYGAETSDNSYACLDLPEVSTSITIDQVAYYNQSVPAVLTVIASSGYQYDYSGNKIIVQSMPTTINTQMTAPVVVDYTAAADPLQTYPTIKQAGLLLLTHFYNQRSNSTDVSLKDIPFGVSCLLRPYKPLVM